MAASKGIDFGTVDTFQWTDIKFNPCRDLPYIENTYQRVYREFRSNVEKDHILARISNRMERFGERSMRLFSLSQEGENRDLEDRGFFDVLSRFTESRDFKVTDTFESHWIDYLGGDLAKAKAANGACILEEKIIWINKHRPRLQQLGVLAHELAHTYSVGISGYIGLAAEEQVVETVACFILDDFGYDIWDFSYYYLLTYEYMLKKHSIWNGGLDNEIGAIYTAFSNDLRMFLNNP